MTLRWISLCGLAALIATAASAQEPAANEPALDRSVAALLSALQSRDQKPKLSRAERERVLAAMLASLDLEAEADQPDLPTRIDEPVTLKGLYAYACVRHIGKGLASVADGVLADIPEGHYEAAILDMRSATGNCPQELGNAFAFLKDETVPLVCLLGRHTGSAPARLAEQLRSTYKAILVGQPPRASRPTGEHVQLDTGESVWLPARASAAKAGQEAPMRLDVEVHDPHAARVNDTTAEDWPALAAKDEALRRGVDLLAAIRAFRQQ